MVAASTELVPSPDPAGMADSRVTSTPQPKAFSCSSSEAYRSRQKSGWNPASVRAALGMEKGDPTTLKCLSSS